MHSPLELLVTNMLSRLRCGWLCLGAMALLGCQPGTPPAPTGPAAEQLVAEVERVLPDVKDKLTQKPAPEAVAPAKPANDPLKDVAPAGPVVPYFNPLTDAEIAEGWISLFDSCQPSAVSFQHSASK